MNKPQVILAIDTSLGGCSVALLKDGKIIASLREENGGQQTKRLVPMIEEALKNGGAAYKDCDAVACTIGPGGFTGIRVGLTAARAIKLATGKPLIGLTTLETIAYGSGMEGDILAVIDAYRGQYYVQRFRMTDMLSPLSGPMLVDEAMLPALRHGAKMAQNLPDAEDVAKLAYARWSAGEREFPHAPLYIREPDAKLPAA